MSRPRSPHLKCRYPNEYTYNDESGERRYILRFKIPNINISWDDAYTFYKPSTFTAPFVLKAPWADPSLEEFTPAWNALDGKVNRRSHEGEYKVQNNVCLNIRGRTGLCGRGVLGRWGPNHAADPIVTRWKRDGGSEEILVDQKTNKNILQFVAIKRKDTGEWAIPGGMVDPGETVSAAIKREFMEEALDSTQASAEDNKKNREMVEKFFKNGEEIYKGYVDDPRNTDNAWMETMAFLFHDDTGKTIGSFPLKAGDDAVDLEWKDISAEISLYASHADFIRKVAEIKNAHW